MTSAFCAAGTPLHSLCANASISGEMLRLATQPWADDDFAAWLQTDALGLSPMQILSQTVHDLGPLPTQNRHSSLCSLTSLPQPLHIHDSCC